MANERSTGLTRRDFLWAAAGSTAAIGAMTPFATLSAAAYPSLDRWAHASAAKQAASWRRLPSDARPSSRRDHSLTLDAPRGLLWMYGGRVTGPDLGLEDLWRLDLATSQWHAVPVNGTLPPGRFGHNAWLDAGSGQLVIAMGQASSTESFDDVWTFNPDAGTWSQIAEGEARPVPRYGAGGYPNRDGSSALVSHGFTIHGRFDDTWRFDVGNHSWEQLGTVEPLPLARCLTRCLWDTDRGRLLLFGGQSDVAPYMGDFWVLDLSRNLWSERPSEVMPAARHLYAADLDGSRGRWLVFAGRTEEGPSSELWAYDLTTDVWFLVPTQAGPAPRFSHDVALADGRLFLFGGNDGSADLDDTWVLDLRSPS